ncbi:MAG: 4Fe-4S binding protein [Mobilitalea sp.]
MNRQKLRKALLFISFLIFPVTLFYFSPYLIIQGGIAGIISGSFIIFAAQFIFSLFFGRAYCSWLCPAGGLQECCTAITNKPLSNRKVSWIKYILWTLWILGIVFAFISAGGIRLVDFFYMTNHGISAASLPGMLTYLGIIGLITILALTLGRRGMCHSICWMAPFMVLGTLLSDLLRLPSLHLKPLPANCINCGHCTKKCPMSLEVHTMVLKGNMKHSECILCGECVDTCPKKAISLTFHK